MFSPFGEVQSVKIERDTNNNESKGFGFVCFVDSDSAKKAIESLNGKKLNDDLEL